MRFAWLLFVLPAACSTEVPVEVQAELRFGQFQDALLRKDRKALRTLVCRDARPALGQLCEANLTGRKPLEVTRVTRSDVEYRVHVRDPDGRSPAGSFYVLTKEDGELRVDLLATTSYHTLRGGARRKTIVPGRLSAAQREQARAMLAKPGR